MSSQDAHGWIGQTLAERYHVTEKLGAGGMGTVYKASDIRLVTDVVIKVPHPMMIRDAEFAARFHLEIRSLVKLSHPNIVKALDVGVHDGLPFAVMQYLSGGSLEDRVRPCRPAEVAAWLPDVAAALDFLHSEGLVHRDIKPDNILFDASGRAYLGDFGIAKVLAESEESDAKRLTGTGTLIGTAEYMAPEMLIPSAYQEAYNERIDQYSLGVTVYEQLSGRPPFRGNTMAEVVVLLATKPATLLHNRNSDIPELVSRVVGRSLFKKPDRRYASCLAFSESFASAVSGEAEPAVGKPSSPRRKTDAPAAARRQATQFERPGKSVARPRTPTVPESSPPPVRQSTVREAAVRRTLAETQPERGETIREKRPPAVEESVKAPLQKNWSSRNKVVLWLVGGVICLSVPVLAILIGFVFGNVHPNGPNDSSPVVTSDQQTDQDAERKRLADQDAARKREADQQSEKAAAVLVPNPDPPAVLSQVPTSTSPEVENSIPEMENSIGMELKLLLGGTFMMGEGGAAHQVILTKPFYLGVYEVTQTQYERVMGNNPSKFKGQSNPVEQVSWDDAVEFCRKLSSLPGEKSAGRVYRLPTEAEWEYACRAGTTTAYSFGDNQSHLTEYGWFRENSGRTTHAVGKKKPNPWGLFDMHGNVYEWCQDRYGTYPDGPVTDPMVPASGSTAVRRGGGWSYYASACSSSYRISNWPDKRPSALGFRVVLSPAAQEHTGAMSSRRSTSHSSSHVGAYGHPAVATQVKFTGQPGMVIGWKVSDGWANDQLISGSRFDFPQNAVYQLKFTGFSMEGYEGLQLYPTLEVRGTDPNTREYLEHSVVPVEVTEEDLEHVIHNNMVTKVIYLPDPKHQSRAIAAVETLISTRLAPGIDPVQQAERMGSILVVLRFGNKDLEMPTAVMAANGTFATEDSGDTGAERKRLADQDTSDQQTDPVKTNSIGMQLKFLPGGTFSMGSDSGDSDERLHQVTLTQPFYMGVSEVTQEQYERVMGTNPSHFKGAKHPVEQVSWDDAVSFCRMLSSLPAEKSAGRVYRLPTEAEWEYACRAGTTTEYSFSDRDSRLDEYAWFADNSGKTTHPVGRQRANGWGLYDMHGNVWEWCSDWYGEYPSGSVRNPSGPSSGSFRVFRGGCWFYAARNCRSANRDNSAPDDRYRDLGFRLVLSPSAAGGAR
ncbi:MAG: bifunctional serine/threonine-protein kinase/formylglycine-generating enzyme family protein [Fuerstiella sp.]|nr:bifunctional serine/threonine-protein kinase/formylglycine-generating enzyme family protein [Fuerstiella sp.]